MSSLRPTHSLPLPFDSRPDGHWMDTHTGNNDEILLFVNLFGGRRRRRAAIALQMTHSQGDANSIVLAFDACSTRTSDRTSSQSRTIHWISGASGRRQTESIDNGCPSSTMHTQHSAWNPAPHLSLYRRDPQSNRFRFLGDPSPKQRRRVQNTKWKVNQKKTTKMFSFNLFCINIVIFNLIVTQNNLCVCVCMRAPKIGCPRRPERPAYAMKILWIVQRQAFDYVRCSNLNDFSINHKCLNE